MKFEIMEVLNIIGRNGNRSLNPFLDKVNLELNDYKNGILRYFASMDDVRDQVYTSNYNVILRVYVRVSHAPLLKCVQGRQTLFEETNDPNHHLLVFENWYKDPAGELCYYAETEQQLFRLSTPGKWRLVDVDGFFKGNSFYRESMKINLVK